MERTAAAAMLEGPAILEGQTSPGAGYARPALSLVVPHTRAREAREHEVFRLIVAHAKDVLSGDVAWLALADHVEERVQVKVAIGATSAEFTHMEVPLGVGIGGVAVDSGRPIVVHDDELPARDLPVAVATTLQREGIRSVLCAPMIKDGVVVGALYIGIRAPHGFDRGAAALLAALGAQAAVTIENARLYQALTEQRDALQQASEAHRILTDASLSGAGSHDIAAEVCRLIQRPVELEILGEPQRSLTFSTDGTSRPTGPDSAEVAVRGGDAGTGVGARAPITAAGADLGVLRAPGDEPLSSVQHRTLEHGAMVIALGLVKEEAIREVEWRMQGDLLDELLRLDGPASDSLRARATRAGIDLALPHCIAVLTTQDPSQDARMTEFVRRHLSGRPGFDGLMSRRDGQVVVVLRDVDGRQALRDLEDLYTRATRADITFRCGLSRAHARWSTALREARAAHGLASRKAHMLIRYEQLGPLRFVLGSPNTDEILDVVEEYVGPLVEYDAQRRGDLALTLRTFLARGGHHPSTRADCHIHGSTLKYRLARIAEITGKDINLPTIRFEYGLAFELLGVLELLGVSPYEGIGGPTFLSA